MFKEENAWLTDKEYKCGLIEEEYDLLLQQQGGVCFICQKPCSSGRKLAVDHDKETDMVRGLLCGKCNLAFGVLGETLEILSRAMAYKTRKDTGIPYLSYNKTELRKRKAKFNKSLVS